MCFIKMKKIANNLYQSRFDIPFGKTEGQPFCQTAAYLLVNSKGNTLFYSSKYIEEHFDFIAEKGGVSFQMLNHRDEASPYSDKVLEKFNAPLVCHHLEKEAVAKQSQVGKTISGGEVFGDIKAIHTPGHCPGSACFLVNQEDGNILFSGDTFYPRSGQWRVAIRKENQEEMIDSLKKLRELEVSLIVPSLYIGYPSFEKFEDKKKYHSAINECVTRLKRGGNTLRIK